MLYGLLNLDGDVSTKSKNAQLIREYHEARVRSGQNRALWINKTGRSNGWNQATSFELANFMCETNNDDVCSEIAFRAYMHDIGYSLEHEDLGSFYLRSTEGLAVGITSCMVAVYRINDKPSLIAVERHYNTNIAGFEFSSRTEAQSIITSWTAAMNIMCKVFRPW